MRSIVLRFRSTTQHHPTKFWLGHDILSQPQLILLSSSALYRTAFSSRLYLRQKWGSVPSFISIVSATYFVPFQLSTWITLGAISFEVICSLKCSSPFFVPPFNRYSFGCPILSSPNFHLGHKLIYLYSTSLYGRC